MGERLDEAWALLPERLGAHVLLSASALALAVLIALPLAFAAIRRPRLRNAVLGAAGLIQTVPGLALVALFYPALLALSVLTSRWLGFGVPALGFLPALLALTLYALLPILRNAVAGLAGLDPAVLEAADGVGMTRRQRLWRVEAPLAAPVVMAGVRTAAVLTLGTAVLATTVGQPSLGDYIFSGLQTEDWTTVLFGCAAAAGLALITDRLLGLVEDGVARRDRVRLLIGAAGLALGVSIALGPMLLQRASDAPVYRIGAKNFSEQFILAELIGRRLAAQDLRSETRTGLGSAVIFRALAAGDIDVYVDYSGTLWTNVLGRTDTPRREVLLAELTTELKRVHGVTLLGPLGFENSYALTMRADRAQALGVVSLDDLARRAPTLRLGADLEFLNRPEWAALRDAYGLEFRASNAYTPTFMYRALEGGEADVISAFSSDGRLAGDRLRQLSDPRGAAPSYDAVLLISPQRASDPELRRVLAPLVKAISVERMRAANASVDSDADKRSPAQAATALGRSLDQKR